MLGSVSPAAVLSGKYYMQHCPLLCLCAGGGLDREATVLSGKWLHATLPPCCAYVVEVGCQEGRKSQELYCSSVILSYSSISFFLVAFITRTAVSRIKNQSSDCCYLPERYSNKGAAKS